MSSECVSLCMRKAAPTREALEREEGPLAFGHEGGHEKRVHLSTVIKMKKRMR